MTSDKLEDGNLRLGAGGAIPVVAEGGGDAATEVTSKSPCDAEGGPTRSSTAKRSDDPRARCCCRCCQRELNSKFEVTRRPAERKGEASSPNTTLETITHINGNGRMLFSSVKTRGPRYSK